VGFSVSHWVGRHSRFHVTGRHLHPSAHGYAPIRRAAVAAGNQFPPQRSQLGGIVMNYPFPKHRIDELVSAPKVVRENEQLSVERRGEAGAAFHVNLDLQDGPFVDLRYLGKAGNGAQPHTYEANLILAGYRVRGVGHHAVGRNNLRAKRRIPAGWHQNICDPNLPTVHPESNRHEPLQAFAPSDLGDFINQCARLWAIDLKAEEPLL
jgi:hypothetical protein